MNNARREINRSTSKQKGGLEIGNQENGKKSCVPIKYVYLRYDIQSMFMR